MILIEHDASAEARAGGRLPAGQSPAPLEHVDSTPRRARRTEIEIEAEAALGHHWVTLLGLDRPQPRHFGDNLGMLPVWVEANVDWRQAGAVVDRHQPARRVVRLAVLGVSSEAHALRLKAALDEALHGREEESGAPALRHRFRNAIDLGDLETWWTPLLQDALITCSLAAAGFDVFTRAEHDAAVARWVAGQVRRRREARR